MNAGTILEPPITWIDVARTLSDIDPSSEEWKARPASLVSARVDWLGAAFEFAGSFNTADFFTWLEGLFPHRVEHGEIDGSILVDGPSNAGRLPVELRLTSSAELPMAQVPLGAVESQINFVSSAASRSLGLPIVACHSVKGGSGRTTTALACASVWAGGSKKPVLIVDADLEAPGLSFLYRRERGQAQISFEDVIALAHADESNEWENTIGYVVARLSGQRIEDVYVLPLRRELDELASSSIRVEHLASARRPYAIIDILRRIAVGLGCAGVVIDVRAGLVPIAAQLILDPSVDRIFVTSLSSQSLEATAALIRYTSREARRRSLQLSQPLILVNRIPSILRETGADETLLEPMLSSMTYELERGRSTQFEADEPMFSVQDDIQPLKLVKIPEISDLQATSAQWTGFLQQVQTAGFLQRLSVDLEEWLQITKIDRAGTDSSSLLSHEVGQSSQSEHDDRCWRLSRFAGRMVAAEVSEEPVSSPLITGPLRALAEQFTTQLPIVVSEGAKGTGKTLTARFLIAQESWSQAVHFLSGKAASFDAQILPVLGSIQASERLQTEIDARREKVSKLAGNGSFQQVHETVSYLRESIEISKAPQDRVKLWLSAIAKSAGFDSGRSENGDLFLKHLRDKNIQLLAVIEGLEELYPDAFVGLTPAWLRSLLVDLPLRLKSEPGRPLGLIVFARRDSVDAAVPQNSDQFRRLYGNFALSWSEGDVLELAAWLATKSDALSLWSEKFRSQSQSERESTLYPLWGRKLGPDDRPGRRTAEAYTANWIVAVLSDLQSRLVARDLVRLLENAAQASVGINDEEFTRFRLLSPRSLKDAVKPTSVAKVAETVEEISELKPVFDKFRRHPDRVIAPLDAAAITALGLLKEDIQLLQRHAIVFGDAPPYEVPELFRMGLNLKHSGARHSVINLRRRARQRLGLPV